MIPESALKQLHAHGFRSIEEGTCSECGKLAIAVTHPENGRGALHPLDDKGGSCQTFAFVPLDPPVTYKDPEEETKDGTAQATS